MTYFNTDYREAIQGAYMDEVNRLQTAIRKHRDYRGDDRCWWDDEELYTILPEGYTPPKRDTLVEAHNCDRYRMCRQNPSTTYVSPQREIERLRVQAGFDWVIILTLITTCAALSYQLYIR